LNYSRYAYRLRGGPRFVEGGIVPALLERARNRSDSKRIQRLKKRVEEDGSDHLAEFELIQAMWDEGDREASVRRCRKLVVRKRVPDGILEHAAIFLFERRAIEEARDCFERLGASNPARAMPRYFLGRIHQLRGDSEASYEAHDESIDLEPQNAECYYRYGVTLSRSERPEEAERYFRKALELDQSHAKAYTNLGYLLDIRGRSDEAMRLFRKAVQCNPNSAEAHFNLGALFGENGDHERAIREFHLAIRLDPDCVEAHFNLGLALFECGELNEALQSFKTVLKYDASHRDARYYVGMVLYRKGVYSRALKILQQVLRDDPGNPSVLYHIGVCYNRMDQPVKAIPPLKRVTELLPDDGRAYYYLGVVYDKTGRVDEAKQNYRTADSLFHKSGPQSAA
jgi:tetratricopeptide (TPR) repeat protein